MKEFSLKEESAYDLNTYSGRVKHFQKLTNPLNWFISNKTLAEYNAKIQDTEECKKKYTNEELWKAKYALLGNYHPQKNAPIHKLFRSSGFVITNAPIAFMMSVMPPTFANQCIGQVLNQTYNFLFNFCNQNASNEYALGQMLISYGLAVGFSLVGALGTLALVQKLRVTPTTSIILKRLSPFIGIGTANVANLFFSRYQDFKKGILVADAQTGQTIDEHTSLIASKIGFMQTAVTRLTIPIPIVIFPPLIMHFLEKMKVVPKTGLGQIISGNLVALCCLYFAFTYSLAIFPQMVRVPASELEPCFHNLKRKDGTVIKEFVFNKGL